MVFTKCAKCGQKIYGYCDIGAEIVECYHKSRVGKLTKVW
jgi:hypothetical protein